MATKELIPCGYILFSRQTLKSGIMEKPPLYLKLWAWMLLNAKFKDTKTLKRGQLFTTIEEMRNAMSYKAGYRTERPTIKQIRVVYDFLTRGTMIVTAKVTGGMVITILNYGRYQNPKSYEGHTQGHNEIPTRGIPSSKDKNDKKNDKKDKPPIVPLPDFVDLELWEQFLLVRKKKKAVNSEYAMKLLINKIKKFHTAGFDANEIIETSIENSWKSFFEPGKNKFKKNNLHEHLVQVGKEFIEDERI